MQTISANDIIVSDRQRKEISPKELLDLKRSILEKGLLHAPVCSKQGDALHLVAGERRLRAMMELHEEGHTFSYNSTPVERKAIPYVLISDLSPTELWEAELEENILRQPLTWMEEAEAKAKIHKARQAVNPKQTVIQTAREIAERTQKAVVTENINLAASLLVDKHKDNVKVQNAKSLAEANRVILDEAESYFKAQLARRSQVLELPHKLIKGDCMEVMKTLPANHFDCIFSDPPYGIGADKMKKDVAHYYDDSEEYALSINKFVLSEGFRLTKPRALIFLFCDIEHFLTLREFAAQQAWVPWRTPIIWYKGAQGHAPWGRAGFTRTYEAILFASKGQKELYAPGGPDVINLERVTRGDRVHAAEKPVVLYEALLRSACIPGDVVLDPCCGSGTIFPAAESLRLHAYGIEKDDTYFDKATVRLGELSSPKEEDKKPTPSKPSVANLLDL